MKLDKPLTGKELVEEVDWLISAGMHPQYVADTLGKSLAAIAIACRRADRKDLATHFYAVKDLVA